MYFFIVNSCTASLSFTPHPTKVKNDIVVRRHIGIIFLSSPPPMNIQMLSYRTMEKIELV